MTTIPQLDQKDAEDLFYTLRGYMCSRCNRFLSNQCHDLSTKDQVKTMLTCMCEYEVLKPDDGAYPVLLPEII